jgi:hypothetical protein
VQLDSRIAKRKTLVYDIQVLIGRVKRDGACIRWDAGAKRSQQLMHRLIDVLTGDVPEGGVNESLDIDWELFDTVEFPKPVPEPLSPQRILADKFIPQAAFNDIGDDWTTNGGNNAFNPLVGLNT